MSQTGKIKVIKKGTQKPEPTPVKKARPPRVAARDIVSNVSTWVNEFQVRKRDETKIAIEKFFGSSPQPSEM